MTVPRLSVLIPTFNRSAMLGDVLRGLAAQTVRAHWETIVLDDGSTDDTEAAAETWKGEVSGLRYVKQDNAGLNVARNAAADAAQGELLVYLDDDVLLPTDFVAEMMRAFDSRPEAAAVGGRILLQFEASAPPWLTGNLRLYLSELDRGDNVQVLAYPDYPRGACFGIRAGVLRTLGGFRAGLDRQGTNLISSGEQEMFRRLHEAGHTVVYWPAAVVRHRVPAERLTVEFFERRASAQGASDAILEGDQPNARTFLRESARALRALPIAAKGIAQGRGTINARLWLCYSKGRVSQGWKGR